MIWDHQLFSSILQHSDAPSLPHHLVAALFLDLPLCTPHPPTSPPSLHRPISLSVLETSSTATSVWTPTIKRLNFNRFSSAVINIYLYFIHLSLLTEMPLTLLYQRFTAIKITQQRSTTLQCTHVLKLFPFIFDRAVPLM